MIKSYCPFPLTLGASVADGGAVLPSSGRAVAVEADYAPVAGTPVAVAGVPIPVTFGTRPGAVRGLPESGDVIVPLAVVSAMRDLKIRHAGKVYSPAPLAGTAPNQYVPGLIYWPEVSAA